MIRYIITKIYMGLGWASMDFYVIDTSNRFVDKIYAYGEELNHETGDFLKCKICGVPVSMREWLSPRTVKLSKPKYGDFIFGTFSTFLCSERFKDLYTKSKLKGIIDFQPVDILKINRKKANSPEPPTYFNVVIAIGEGRIDEIKSKMVKEYDQPKCNYCMSGIIESFEGVYIDVKTWDGKDIFYPRGLPGTIVITSHFYDFLVKNNFTNISVVPSKEYKPKWILK